MNAIVNVTSHWGIGKNGKLLVSIPTDLHRFRELTIHKTVIYGRKTLETFPHAKPLPKRENIILSRNPAYAVEGAAVVHSVKELQNHLPENTDDYIVIGGDSIYRALLPLCDECIITKVESTYEADAWFPNLDEDPEWECIEKGEDREENGQIFHYDVYRRIR
jgi:dihydrofolate reductase